MAALVRWNPFREMTRMQDLMDRLVYEDSVLRDALRRGEAVGAVPVDIYETPEAFVVRAPLAGVKPENVEVTYEAGVLTIRGEVVEEKDVEGECLCQERGFGKFARSISLPGDVVADKIEASLKDGVLTLKIPKAEEMKPRRIAVKVE